MVAERPEGDDALLQGGIVQIGHARFDGLVEAFQAKLGLGRAPVQLGDMLPAPIRPLLASIED
ncbi:hypothetical protein [Roseomonas mucosa]|uniref:hypothetical protein n=1 Tax=Roseomonas mucosa TaxID=207340 RepID=UPI00209B4F12|nr:hypothetical protein [Roseomonas mucosa]